MTVPLYDVSAQRADLSFTRGDDISVTVHVTSSGTDVDLSGTTITAQIRPYADALSTVATFTPDMSDATTGRTTLTLASAATATLLGVYRWDMQAVTSGLTRTWCGGVVTVLADVTR